MATLNGLARLEAMGAPLETVEQIPTSPRELDRKLGSDAVHQGVVLECEDLPVSNLDDLQSANLLVMLDQITDPHNAGAILRSAVACGAQAVVTTARHSPARSGVLAKAASGALDLIDWVSVTNLSQGMLAIRKQGFQVIGLDSDADGPLEEMMGGDRVALVLGAEGRGLRQKTRQNCDAIAAIDLPGEIRSLNVSNAAAISLYVARRHLDRCA